LQRKELEKALEAAQKAVKAAEYNIEHLDDLPSAKTPDKVKPGLSCVNSVALSLSLLELWAKRAVVRWSPLSLSICQSFSAICGLSVCFPNGLKL
jgi:hypothetical protein